jgi:hypothetical protein
LPILGLLVLLAGVLGWRFSAGLREATPTRVRDIAKRVRDIANELLPWVLLLLLPIAIAYGVYLIGKLLLQG